MAEKLITIIILSTIFVRGEMCKEGDEVDVTEKEAKELIARGVATDEALLQVTSGDTVSFNEMTLEELGEVDYTKLNKDPLVEFATACGLTITDETKDDIYSLLEDVDFEEAE
ncbi:hypothetical protein [Sulfurimonas sp.]|uniref:DUF7210 family protein n=1 Tax=Sulfurimonas sp. TaxID=2022749 RepID=UPI0025F2C552|nr:hypothetical protein [Sulfurimonas sp.]